MDAKKEIETVARTIFKAVKDSAGDKPLAQETGFDQGEEEPKPVRELELAVVDASNGAQDAENGLQLAEARLAATKSIVQRLAQGPLKELQDVFAEIEAAENYVRNVESSLKAFEMHVENAERQVGIDPSQRPNIQTSTSQNWFGRLIGSKRAEIMAATLHTNNETVPRGKGYQAPLSLQEIPRPLELLSKAHPQA